MSDASVTREELRRSFMEESTWLRFSSPLFSTLARACAADRDMIDLASATRPGQSAGMLLPMVAHYLVFKTPESALARYFPSLTATPAPSDEAFPAFREFCLDRRDEVSELLASRTVGTNLVERSSTILPLLAYVSQRAHEPLSLVEICCSAGLNLLFDEYHYDYGAAGRLGPDQSPVQLDCRIIGRHQPPVAGIPRVVSRVGVDLVKVDPLDPIERMWLEATLFPEWTLEREHLRAALVVREKHPVRIIAGNALEVLPSLLDELSGTICVLQTHCMGQWTDEAKGQLDDIFRRASRNRDIHRVGIDRVHGESPDMIRERLIKVAAARIPLQQKSFPSRIDYTWYANGDGKSAPLGMADGCGAWIDWQVAA
jgi:hypothetical protein